MRLAVLEYNDTQDPKRSMPHYEHIVKTYPTHPDAERAMYFLALEAVQVGERSLAESSCKAFIQKYPSSGWRKHIEAVLRDEVPQLEQQPKEKR